MTALAPMTRKKLKIRKNKKKGSKLLSLLTSALAIPGVAGSLPARAEDNPDAPMVRFKYAYYDERQEGGEDRMQVWAPMTWFRLPVGEKTAVEGHFVYDSMSGASPLFHSTLSGATGIGVDDNRRAADLRVTHSFENFSVAVGTAFSHEDDYESKGGVLETSIWTPDKDTTFTIGAGYNTDDITSTNDAELDEERDTQSYLLGVTQIINPTSVIQGNLTYSSGDGYFSDPYKPLDRRPRSRDQFAALARYVLFLEDFEGSLHTDYRIFWDSWKTFSHTVEVSWYQPLGENWLIRPGLRYYIQKKAELFSSIFPPDDVESIYTADQRLSTFGGVTASLKLIRELPQGFSLDGGFYYIFQHPDLALGYNGSSVIEDFHAWFFLIGLGKSF